jgi:carbonic anhydrase/acetyltransferase-like protein (isoleucine patch superfamily)
MIRRALTWVALGPIAVAASLLFACYKVRLLRFLTASRLAAMAPGAVGIHLRRFWYRWTLAACGDALIVDWMAVLKAPSIRIGHRVFVGSFSFIAECELRDDVLIAHHVVVQGGPHTHEFERTDIPIREQAAGIHPVTIGPDVWIGTGARVLADVAPGTVVGAGAVVTRVAEPYAVLAGVPARTLRRRGHK